jgi:hypothetical protein
MIDEGYMPTYTRYLQHDIYIIGWSVCQGIGPLGNRVSLWRYLGDLGPEKPRIITPTTLVNDPKTER